MLGFYNYTVILTYVSLLISSIGIYLAAAGHPFYALCCLLASGICDMFDGKIARTRKKSTAEEKRFGIQIDSLCDVICFGVLPSAIGVSLVASQKNITEADCDSFMFYKDEETGMSGGFDRKGDQFILLDKPGFGLDINF
jgi:phosphatidylserine synthase